LPGVGPVRAARLSDKYGSVEAVLTTDREDLRLVPGIGNAAAGGIQWAATEPDIRIACAWAAWVSTPPTLIDVLGDLVVRSRVPFGGTMGREIVYERSRAQFQSHIDRVSPGLRNSSRHRLQ
jgi:hypothetical protein